jgi:hypothetical protein
MQPNCRSCNVQMVMSICVIVKSSYFINLANFTKKDDYNGLTDSLANFRFTSSHVLC